MELLTLLKLSARWELVRQAARGESAIPLDTALVGHERTMGSHMISSEAAIATQLKRLIGSFGSLTLQVARPGRSSESTQLNCP